MLGDNAECAYGVAPIALVAPSFVYQTAGYTNLFLSGLAHEIRQTDPYIVAAACCSPIKLADNIAGLVHGVLKFTSRSEL